MSIIYQSRDSSLFYVIEEYTVDQQLWVRYNNSEGKEFTCLKEAFLQRFTPLEQL